MRGAARFSQADSSTTLVQRHRARTRISKRLAEVLGGTMSAESGGLGKGSTFHFTIVAPVATQPPGARRELIGEPPALAGKRLLIVDDNATNRTVLFLQNRPREARGRRRREAVRRVPFEAAAPVAVLRLAGRDALADAAARRGTDGARNADDRYRDGGGHPLRILLAEDNLVNQKLELRLLLQMGYLADVAANGIEAIERLGRHTDDVVLMDVQMPDMGGLDATWRICARWTAGERPRIVAMTATNAMKGDREECIAAGMDDYLTKPIRVDSLVEALDRIRGRARGQTADD